SPIHFSFFVDSSCTGASYPERGATTDRGTAIAVDLLSMMRRLGGVALLSSPAGAVALELLAPERQTALFFASILAIVPLAGYIGQATDELPEHFGGAIGGLPNP